MTVYSEARNPALRGCVLDAVRALSTRFDDFATSGRYISHRSHYPIHEGADDYGWPKISSPPLGDGPLDHTSPFGPAGGQRTEIAFSDVPELQRVIDLVLGDEHLAKRTELGVPLDDDLRRWLQTFTAAHLALEVFERVRHTVGPTFTDADVDVVYLEREAALYLDDLPIDIVVPIVGAKFEISDRFELGAGVHIERMSDDFQRVRHTVHPGVAAVNPNLLRAATHAVVLTDRTYPGDDRFAPQRGDFWPSEDIDRVFRSIDTIHPVAAGYAQFLARPRGWSSSWTVDLPALVPGLTVRRYPPWFDHGVWNTHGETFPAHRLEELTEVYGRLVGAPGPVDLAARRLGRASLRERRDDVIIDLCIALEAMFGNDGGGEIVHKLATRTAAAVTFGGTLPEHSAPDLFRYVKKIYQYRSAVVHGDARPGAGTITLANGSTQDTIALARSIVRAALQAVLDDPSLAKPPELDARILDQVAQGGSKSSDG